MNMIPGNWSEHMNSPVEAADSLHFNNPVSAMGDESQRIRSLLPYPISEEERLQAPSSIRLGVEAQNRPTTAYHPSPNTADELFFDYPLTSQVSTATQNEGSAPTSYLIFEPVVEEEFTIEDTDWRRYDPPQEQLRTQEGISHDLSSIIVPSIERIQARHVEEERRRAEASRIERPLARAGRASVKPRRQVGFPYHRQNTVLTCIQISLTVALDTTHLSPPPRLGAISDASLSSSDSGYGSASPGAESPRSPRLATRRSLGLAGLFKRKERTIVNPNELDENHLPRPRNSEAWLLSEPFFPSSPTRGAIASESLTG